MLTAANALSIPHRKVGLYMDILPVNYVLDPRKLNFLYKQSLHHMAVVNALFMVTGCKEFEELFS